MKLSRSTAVSFGVPTAVMIGAAGVLRVVCPGGCPSCETCVTALAPVGVSAAVVGGILAAPLATRRSRRLRTAEVSAHADGVPVSAEVDRREGSGRSGPLD